MLHQNEGGIGKSIPVDGLMMRRMSVLHQNSGFPLALKISLGLRPREISRVSPNLLGVGDGFPNTALVLVEHEYIALQIYSTYILSKQITKQMEQHVEAYPLSLFPNVIVLEYCAHWLQEVVTG